MSHTLKRNLSKLICISKVKNRKFKIFISPLFQGKTSWYLKCKSKYGFSIALCKTKTISFNFNKKRYSETLIHFMSLVSLYTP